MMAYTYNPSTLGGGSRLEAYLVLLVYSCSSVRKRHEEYLGPEA